jgi:Fe-S cluster biogenesis protein NfuA
VRWPRGTRDCGNVARVDEPTKATAGRAQDHAGNAHASSVVRALSEFVAALVVADGGELYLVSATQEDIHLHLTGTCSGCPGATMTRERLLEPALQGVTPKANLRVTTGWRVPEGARRIDPAK